jgi:hypothetical protein
MRLARTLALGLGVLLLLDGLPRGRGALLTRPEQDCLNPSLSASKINSFNFFPDDYRAIIAETHEAEPGATVRGAAGRGGPLNCGCVESNEHSSWLFARQPAGRGPPAPAPGSSARPAHGNRCSRRPPPGHGRR